MIKGKKHAFDMPRIWMVDGKLYEVTLPEIVVPTVGGARVILRTRKLVFTPLDEEKQDGK